MIHALAAINLKKPLGWLPIWFLTLFVICSPHLLPAQSKPTRPKLGLTLSGGGARGLAHIGLLKAIDSVGLKIDYVTGTSMGAIVGSLYAAGYSGNDILKIASNLDWNNILTNKSQLTNVRFAEKEDYDRYLLELPFVKGQFLLPRGVLESNELWLKLNELFLPYYKIKDFAKFQRAFQCIATDLVTGESVVLTKGNIAQAVRASMAIPAFFSPVPYEGKLLVDGGIVRNFPVANARDMGAGFIIGSNVSAGLYKEENLSNPFSILNQISFYRESYDFTDQRKLTDLYIDYPLEKYSSASFTSTQQIIQLGLEEGKRLYPKLKRLKDSLDARYGQEAEMETISRVDSVLVTDVVVEGLDKVEAAVFLRDMAISKAHYYRATSLNQRIRPAFGTDYFQKISYELQPVSGDNARLIFQVQKAPGTYLRLGLSYNSATGIGIKAGFKVKHPTSYYATASLALSLGENPRLETNYATYIGKMRTILLKTALRGESTDIFTYNQDFERSGLYNQTYFGADVHVLKIHRGLLAYGLGTRYERLTYSPKIVSQLQARGHTSFVNSYVSVQANTLNSASFPTKGYLLNLEGGIIYRQRPSFTVSLNNQVLGNQDSSLFSFDSYYQSKLFFEYHIPAGKHSFFYQLQSAINYKYKQVFLNDFIVGGLNPAFRNQISFAGLPAASLFTSSVATVQAGYQYTLATNVYLLARLSGLWHDFMNSNLRAQEQSEGFALGYSVSAGYKSFLGPITISMQYSNLNKQLSAYFNIGFPLGY
ncbi:hypothetical protein GO730_09420 [Spirosoma sp. HMF3257]|nr:hypothetical protein [Spirosoma telluris]